jgi:hypothetical protein
VELFDFRPKIYNSISLFFFNCARFLYHMKKNIKWLLRESPYNRHAIIYSVRIYGLLYKRVGGNIIIHMLRKSCRILSFVSCCCYIIIQHCWMCCIRLPFTCDKYRERYRKTTTVYTAGGEKGWINFWGTTNVWHLHLNSLKKKERKRYQ